MAAHSLPVAEKKIVIAGFSDVGKTTLLAALWHVLTRPGEVPGALTLSSLPKEAEYLNQLRDQWQGCEKVPHTSISSEKNLTLELATANGTKLGKVVLPDLAGETFSAQWSQRQAPAAMAELFREACGILLLVNVKSPDFHVPERLRDQGSVAALLCADVGTLTTDVVTTEVPQVVQSWNPKSSGTDVQLVDLLQCIRFHWGESTKPVRLALGASAWDQVDDKDPQAWLRHHLPLLKQYLDSNPDLFKVRLYGISAQGGSYDQETDSLLEKPKPSERIKVIGDGCGPHDVTAPIAWLLSS